MAPLEFPDQFIHELADILHSEASSQHYDHAGKIDRTTHESFTGDWEPDSLGFEQGAGRRRAVANFSGGGRHIKAVIDAADFSNLIHGEHDPAFNPTQYSDLAFYVSILLMEQILTRDPAEVAAEEVRICSAA